MTHKSSLFRALLKRQSVGSNPAERVLAFSRTRGSDCAPTLSGLPGQISDSEGSEFDGVSRPPSPTLKEDEGMHLRWQRVLAGRDASKLSPEELLDLSATGMPLKHRHALWPQCFAAPGAPDMESLQADVTTEAAEQIELDIERTQPQWLGPIERRTLRRVLRAYAAAHPTVGYCQGMNNIAAVFVLLGFDENTALRGCEALLQGACPGYHDRDLAGFRLDAQVLGELSRRVLPAGTLARLAALDVPLEVLVSEHFLTLASRSWPLEATARLWDLILLEGPGQGSPAVFASFLALLQLYLPELQDMTGTAKAGCEEEPEPLQIFRQRVLQGVSEDLEHVLRQVRQLIPQVPQRTIDELRFEFAGKRKC